MESANRGLRSSAKHSTRAPHRSLRVHGSSDEPWSSSAPRRQLSLMAHDPSGAFAHVDATPVSGIRTTRNPIIAWNVTTLGCISIRQALVCHQRTAKARRSILPKANECAWTAPRRCTLQSVSSLAVPCCNTRSKSTTRGALSLLLRSMQQQLRKTSHARLKAS